MSGGHAAGLYRHADTPIHRLAPQCKLVATFLFVLAVVATPRESFWAYACYAAIILVTARVARVPLPFLLRRLGIELPFVAFALFLPIVGGGERTEVLGLSLSVDGLWAAWNIVVKATLGVAATVLLTATTEVPELLHGLERLHLPRPLTSVTSFMVRYAEVVTDEVRRMRVARISRGHDPRWFWQVRAVASSAGALFVRSYERGERVYLAMVSRGFDGAMPTLAERAALPAEWAGALAVPVLAATVAAVAWGVR